MMRMKPQLHPMKIRSLFLYYSIFFYHVASCFRVAVFDDTTSSRSSALSYMNHMISQQHDDSYLPLRYQIDDTRIKRRIFRQSSSFRVYGWLDNLLPPTDAFSSSRMIQYPEQYPATYEMNTNQVRTDDVTIKHLIRPLLKNTQLEVRALQLVYDARRDGWNTKAFHKAVDGKGAAIVLGKVPISKTSFFYVGGYNPKGWSSNGGARPSVASFLFYSNPTENTSTTANITYQKLQKVGGGGLACAKDDPNTGIWFGADGLIIPLEKNDKTARSKLGTYFEQGPKQLSSLFGNGIPSKELIDLYVYTGIYSSEEEIPYSGAVLDLTSG